MQMLFENTCVLCHAQTLVFRKKKTILGITASAECYCCENCGSMFIEDELRWKLIQTNAKDNPIWQQFQRKSMYVREWLKIGNLEVRDILGNIEVALPF